MNYAQFSHNMYTGKVYPFLQNLNKHKDSPLLSDLQIHYCVPSSSADGTRLYPSVLTILSYKAINPEAEINDGVIGAAVAVELFHNYSLVHDDVFDGHDYRRNRETIVKLQDKNYSVLVGNNMVGDSLKLFSALDPGILKTMLSYYGQAVIDLNIGQQMDEGQSWRQVENNKLLDYWWAMSRNKLAVGIFAVQAGAILQRRSDLLSYWTTFEEKISLVSQIMNDTGDIFDYTGFYETAKSNRPTFEETKIKYTYPMIWIAQHYNMPISDVTPEQTNMRKLLLESDYIRHADEEIEKLRNETISQLEKMNLPDSEYKEILYDYLHGPKLPKDLISND